ncbi:MAG: hypothetical protein OXQ89_07420 [Rhodospirillaceae bacterium]|nr:hypothetical protein [Rhodospirillaceae bacterium]MDE0360765.1 hypothetical protein [Rhodospirillaceae bacterium]
MGLFLLIAGLVTLGASVVAGVCSDEPARSTYSSGWNGRREDEEDEERRRREDEYQREEEEAYYDEQRRQQEMDEYEE